MSVIYHPALFFGFSALFGILGHAISLFLYYFNNGLPDNHLVTITDSMKHLPTYRVFSMLMIITAWISMTPQFFIINYIKMKAQKLEINSFSFTLSRKLAVLLAITSFFTLIAYSSLTSRESYFYHYLFYFMFAYCISLFYILIDYQISQCGIHVKAINIIADISIPTLFSISFVIYFSYYNNMFRNITALCEYTGNFIIYMKYVMIWKTIPPIGIAFSMSSKSKSD